jgi:hypothetical protein
MRKSTALVLAAIAIVAVTLWGFQPEANALAWHLRHGMHADGAGLRVRVPLLYSAIGGPDSLILMSQNGRVRARLHGQEGVLVFLSKKMPAPQSPSETIADWWKRTSAAAERQGSHPTGTQTVSFAGRPAQCSEFEGGLFLVGTEIWCIPDAAGGWFVDYTGPRAHVPEFYSLLESAQTR